MIGVVWGSGEVRGDNGGLQGKKRKHILLAAKLQGPTARGRTECRTYLVYSLHKRDYGIKLIDL